MVQGLVAGTDGRNRQECVIADRGVPADDGDMDQAIDPTRTVVFVVFDRLQPLDLTGPMEIFHTAVRMSERDEAAPYRLFLASPTGGPVRSDSSLTITPDGSLTDALALASIDTLVVVGGRGVDAAASDNDVVASVTALARRARRVTSVCTGAFLLAACGLLDGCRVTTHWAYADRLASTYPLLSVDPDPIFIHDGTVWTSAGVTAGMDLTLALVADDLGGAMAHGIASQLVMFTRRPGGQSQFSTAMRLTPSDRTDLTDLSRWMLDHLSGDLMVDSLARRVAMSPRHFARLFAAEFGTTPARHVENLRLERACHLLASTEMTVAAIATEVGLSSEAVLHRLFRRRHDTTPTTYRRHFAEL